MSFDPPIGFNQNVTVEKVGDVGYKDPLRPWLRFADRTGTNTSYIFDGFSSFQPFSITNLNVENGIGETGSANITIMDNGNINEDEINWGNKVYIKLAKRQQDFTGNPDSTFLIGYVRGYRKNRPATGIIQHEVTVIGSKVLFTDRKINYKRSTSSTTSSKFQIKNHIRNIIEDEKSYPVNAPTIMEQGNFDLSGINPSLKTVVGKVNYEMVEAGGAIQRLADIEGARFFIDYKADAEIVTVDYPSNLHTGVIVKSGDLKSNSDPARYSSYFMGSWDGAGSTSSSDGFANRLYTKTMIDRKEFTSSFSNKSSTSLTFKAIAQKFFITETRITDIGLILSRTGEVTSQNNRVNGEIRADNAGNPNGNLISSFNIPLSSIEKTPETIFVNDLDLKQRFVENAAPAWIILYQRSGTEEVNKSDPNHDETNTIRWHHNNDTSTVTTLVSKKASSGDRKDNLVWNYSTDSTHGPTMCFGVFAEIRHIQEVADRGSINRYGLVDGEVDTGFLDEPELIQSYLEALLSFSAKPRIIFGTNSLEIPNNFLFKPYQIITLQDTLAYPNGIDVEIQNASYAFETENYALGCKRASITPVGYHDYLDARLKCF